MFKQYTTDLSGFFFYSKLKISLTLILKRQLYVSTCMRLKKRNKKLSVVRTQDLYVSEILAEGFTYCAMETVCLLTLQ